MVAGYLLEAATPLAQTLGNVLLDEEVWLGRAPASAGGLTFKYPADWARSLCHCKLYHLSRPIVTICDRNKYTQI